MAQGWQPCWLFLISCGFYRSHFLNSAWSPLGGSPFGEQGRRRNGGGRYVAPLAKRPLPYVTQNQASGNVPVQAMLGAGHQLRVALTFGKVRRAVAMASEL